MVYVSDHRVAFEWPVIYCPNVKVLINGPNETPRIRDDLCPQTA